MTKSVISVRLCRHQGVGEEVRVEGLTKSFGRQVIWEDVTLTLPPGEISVLLGPSGTGKSVFLKSLVGLLTPEHGSIVVRDVDLVSCSDKQLYEIRKLYGVLFQDGALFGSMSLYDNIAFPLREHTRKPEREIRDIVTEKMEMVGLAGEEQKLPGEISGGMRKRAGLARALVLQPEIILFDEPDSGLDPVRVAYLNQLIVDLNARTDATFLIVTHDIGTARTVPDNLGLLFRRELVMFGPREQLLTSTEPVVEQFLNGRREGPIGMAEEKDAAQVERELAELDGNGGPPDGTPGSKGATDGGVPPQLEPSEGVPHRQAADRRQARVRQMLHTLPGAAQEAVRRSLPEPPPGDGWRSRPDSRGGSGYGDKRPDDKRPDDKRPDEMPPDDKRPDETRPDDKRPDETRPDETRPDETRPDETRLDETGPDGGGDDGGDRGLFGRGGFLDWGRRRDRRPDDGGGGR